MKSTIRSIFLIHFIGYVCGTLWRRFLRRLALQQNMMKAFGLDGKLVSGVKKLETNLRWSGMLS
jgi:hypothetical protein